jgi:hypothetical protein
MPSIRPGERPKHVHRQTAADPGEIILEGLHQAAQALVQGLILALALEWSKRARRPFLPSPRTGPRPCRRPGHQRWQAIFSALPRPGPARHLHSIRCTGHPGQVTA